MYTWITLERSISITRLRNLFVKICFWLKMSIHAEMDCDSFDSFFCYSKLEEII